MLGLVTLAGYVQIQTGLIDQLVDAETDKKLEQIESQRADLVERGKLREAVEKTRQEGEFFKTITRLQVIALEPMLMLAKFLLIAAVLYAAVALTGRKPEYHTLMSICVYSGFIGLAGHVLRVAMMMYYRRIDMDTSLSMLAEPGKPTVLAAFDPFVIWFWVVVALGLIITRQLSRRMAIVSCVLLCAATMAMTCNRVMVLWNGGSCAKLSRRPARKASSSRPSRGCKSSRSSRC